MKELNMETPGMIMSFTALVLLGISACLSFCFDRGEKNPKPVLEKRNNGSTVERGDESIVDTDAISGQSFLSALSHFKDLASSATGRASSTTSSSLPKVKC
jgi:hypothetical protein